MHNQFITFQNVAPFSRGIHIVALWLIILLCAPLLADEPVGKPATLVYKVELHAAPADKMSRDAVAKSRDETLQRLVEAVERRLKRDRMLICKVAMDKERLVVHVTSKDNDGIQRAKQLLENRGQLEFRIVANPVDHAELIKATDVPAKAGQAVPNVVQDKKGNPIGRWVKAGVDGATGGRQNIPMQATRKGANGEEEILVAIDSYNVNGAHLNKVSAGEDNLAGPCVNFSFDEKGAKLFETFTGENLPNADKTHFRHLGIVIDNVLYSAPRLQSRIGREGQITGNFTKAEVERLVALLGSGPLPAKLILESEKVD